MTKCKHNFAYPHTIWQGKTSNEVIVGRYCTICGLQQAARAKTWGRVPNGYEDMKRELQY